MLLTFNTSYISTFVIKIFHPSVVRRRSASSCRRKCRIFFFLYLPHHMVVSGYSTFCFFHFSNCCRSLSLHPFSFSKAVFNFQMPLPLRRMGMFSVSLSTTARWSVNAASAVYTPIFLANSSWKVYILSILDAPVGV